MRKTFSLLFIFQFIVGVSQIQHIDIPENHFKIDESRGLVVSHIDNAENYIKLENYNQLNINFNGKEYSFNSLPNSINYTNFHLITDIENKKQYKLYFTQLPIISIETNNEIVDEPKVWANFTYADQKKVLVSDIGIEIRGGSSQSFPKKTYDLEFWKDETGNETKDVQFGEMREDDDWILDALYNEPLRLRSFTANKLWLELHEPTYKIEEPKAKSGANVEYVEVFLNGEYNGVYNLSEQVDRSLLKLKKLRGNKIKGELYKGRTWGATTFTSLPQYDNSSFNWGGYELKYPKESRLIDWRNLYDFTDFVMHSPEYDFKNEIWHRFDMNNYSNYFLFLNLLRATDNTGKNIYTAKYKENTPYFYVPWDLDGCFGTIWDGTNENITTDILTNAFMERVLNTNPDNVMGNIANKWVDYRKGVFSYQSLAERLTKQYEFLDSNKIYEREAMVYPNYPFAKTDLDYALNWLDERLKFLDSYFIKVLSVKDQSSMVKNRYVYPNPVNENLYINTLEPISGEIYQIYNYLGQLIDIGRMEGNSIKVNHLKEGSYFLLLNGASYKFMKK